MTVNGWIQIGVFALLLAALTRPLGLYLQGIYDGSVRWLASVERVIYRIAGIDPDEDQHWTRYAGALLAFSLASLLPTYLVLRLQHLLPLNPAGLPAVPARQAFETAASFATNTNWQSYSGEATLSYLAQMTQLTFQNFVSAAAGMGVAVALARGIARRSPGRLGSFWADLVRGTLYLFLPLSLLFSLVLVQQGAVQTTAPYRVLTTLEGAQQTLALGPIASQVAIKQLGTNGGGFFNANAAHPFENPTPLTNLLSLLAILLIPSALTYTYGRMVRKQAHGWAIWAAMFLLFMGGVAATYGAEATGNPIHAQRGVDVSASATQPGGNMEGKEVRFGVAGSALWATATTAASNGSVNAMHDSFTPLGGLAPMVNMQLGEVVFGGVGVGLAGMLVMVVLTVFLAGLMVGRTPEYLGKKIGSREVQVVMLYLLAVPLAILVTTAAGVTLEAGLAGRGNAGPHGLSEILYAFTSTASNNGSAFAGLSGGSYFYNTLLGLNTLIGRFALIVPTLALGGFLAERKIASETAGTFPVTSPLFVVLLIGVILIVGALTFFPVLALGPVVEHLQMNAGTLH